MRHLPAAASDPSFELHSRLHDLADACQRTVDGEDSSAAFFRAVHGRYGELKEAVLAARPTVRLTSSSSSASTTGTAQGEEDPAFWLAGSQHLAETGESSLQHWAALPGRVITLEGTRKLAADFRVKELRPFAPYRVLEQLVAPIKRRWDDAAQACGVLWQSSCRVWLTSWWLTSLASLLLLRVPSGKLH